MGNIFWLASYPKSGNTWLRAFLANLIANGQAPVTLADLPNHGALDADPDLYSRIAGRASTELDFDEICALRPQVHAAIAAAAPRTVFVKTHSMAGVHNGIPLLTPALSAGAIYVARNPLDVAVSMSHHFAISLDSAIAYLGDERAATQNTALFTTEFLGSWSRHVESWARMEGARILILRYEDLLQNPEKGFGKIARLVGLGTDRARVERAIRHASFAALSGMEKRDGFIEAASKERRFFRAGRANQWRDTLTREQVQRVIGAHREQMNRFRYLPAGF